MSEPAAGEVRNRFQLPPVWLLPPMARPGVVTALRAIVGAAAAGAITPFVELSATPPPVYGLGREGDRVGTGEVGRVVDRTNGGASWDVVVDARNDDLTTGCTGLNKGRGAGTVSDVELQGVVANDRPSSVRWTGPGAFPPGQFGPVSDPTMQSCGLPGLFGTAKVGMPSQRRTPPLCWFRRRSEFHHRCATPCPDRSSASGCLPPGRSWERRPAQEGGRENRREISPVPVAADARPDVLKRTPVLSSVVAAMAVTTQRRSRWMDLFTRPPCGV